MCTKARSPPPLGETNPKPFLSFHSVNRPAEHMLARKLIAQGAAIPVELLADPAGDLKPFSIPRPAG